MNERKIFSLCAKLIRHKLLSISNCFRRYNRSFLEKCFSNHALYGSTLLKQDILVESEQL